VLQQVAAPEALHARPENVFVAAFIGSPSMNLCEGSLHRRDGADYEVRLGDQRLGVPAEAVESRPALTERFGDALVVGSGGARVVSLHGTIRAVVAGSGRGANGGRDRYRTVAVLRSEDASGNWD